MSPETQQFVGRLEKVVAIVTTLLDEANALLQSPAGTVAQAAVPALAIVANDLKLADEAQDLLSQALPAGIALVNSSNALISALKAVGIQPASTEFLDQIDAEKDGDNGDS